MIWEARYVYVNTYCFYFMHNTGLWLHRSWNNYFKWSFSLLFHKKNKSRKPWSEQQDMYIYIYTIIWLHISWNNYFNDCLVCCFVKRIYKLVVGMYGMYCLRCSGSDWTFLCWLYSTKLIFNFDHHSQVWSNRTDAQF